MKNLFTLSISVMLFIALSCTQKKQTRPNVLFIAIDDMNDWAGCLDAYPNVQTPNLDALAADGILFSNAHCQAPLCGPSRASIMTGLYPYTTGIYQQIIDVNIKGSSAVATQVVFLPEYFSDHGYKTMGVGKLFHNGDADSVFQIYGGEFGKFGPFPKQRIKYNPEWFGKPKGTVTDWGAFPETDAQMPDFNISRWATERLSEDHETPFFLGVGFIRPHVPWYVPQPWLDRFDINAIETPPYLASDLDDVPAISRAIHEVPMMPTTEWIDSVGEWQEAVRAYLACMAFTDHYMGEVIKALEKSKYADNTIIVLWSDHGYHLGEKNRFAKHSLWQRSTHVPLIFAGNGMAKATISNAPVGLIDMYPTLADLCGLPSPAVDGQSLVPLINDVTSDWKNAAITTYGENNHSVHLGDYHYIHYEDGSEELYNLKTDPNEWNNIASEQSSSEVIAKLASHLPKTNHPEVKESVSRVNDFFRGKR